MKDYIAYHNPDKMRAPLAEFPPFLAVTNNKMADVQHGSRVWVLTGEGKPVRTFFLRSYFTVDEIGPGSYGFKNELSGTRGKEFKPMVRLNDLEWFDDFKLTQGNFSRGFQEIIGTRFIKGLEVAAGTE